MKVLASFACIFVIASRVSVKCLPVEEINTILSEVQKEILNLNADMKNIKRKMLQDLEDRNWLSLKLHQTISRYNGTYEKTEPRRNYTLEISPAHLEWIRALERGLRVEKNIRTESMMRLRNLNHENHYLKQEFKRLTEIIKNQGELLKELQDELRDLKASEKELEIRLVQNDTLHASEGRLELLYDGEWGTVCDDGWDDNDATVVCRMLGFSNGRAKGLAAFGEGSGRIMLDNVECQGHESKLDNCQYAWRRHNCGHYEDAGVICKHLTSPDVRLHFELFEVFHNGTWGTVCDDSFGTTEATVACRMLDYRNGYTRMARAGSGTIWPDNVNCTGNETNIRACRHSEWGETDCTHDEDVGILCRELANTDLRLKGGDLANKGRLEIFHHGYWGTVCDDGWDDQDATVACRMLGFTYGKATVGATFGQGSGRIWLDEVRCKGNETNLEDCQHGGWGRENCFHHEDAGVVCH